MSLKINNKLLISLKIGYKDVYMYIDSYTSNHWSLALNKEAYRSSQIIET